MVIHIGERFLILEDTATDDVSNEYAVCPGIDGLIPDDRAFNVPDRALEDGAARPSLLDGNPFELVEITPRPVTESAYNPVIILAKNGCRKHLTRFDELVCEIPVINPDCHTRGIARDLKERVTDLPVDLITFYGTDQIQPIVNLPARTDDILYFLLREFELVLSVERGPQRLTLRAFVWGKKAYRDIAAVRTLPAL